MNALFIKLKTYWTAFVVAAISALGIAVSLLAKRNRTLAKQRDEAREHSDHAIDVIESDIEVASWEDEHLAEVANGKSDELTNPNDWD